MDEINNQLIARLPIKQKEVFHFVLNDTDFNFQIKRVLNGKEIVREIFKYQKYNLNAGWETKWMECGPSLAKEIKDKIDYFVYKNEINASHLSQISVEIINNNAKVITCPFILKKTKTSLLREMASWFVSWWHNE